MPAVRSARRFPADVLVIRAILWYLWYWLMYSLIFNYHVSWVKNIKAQGNWVKCWRIFGKIIYCYIIYQEMFSIHNYWLGWLCKMPACGFCLDLSWSQQNIRNINQTQTFPHWSLSDHIGIAWVISISIALGHIFCRLQVASVSVVKQDERYFFVWVSIIYLP